MIVRDLGENEVAARHYCIEDEFLIRLMKRGLRMLVRGIAASLLMPIEALHYLAHGRSIGWRAFFSWMLSGLFYVGCLKFWVASRSSALPPIPATMLYLTAVAVAVWFNGSVEASEGSVAIAGGWNPSAHHHHHHHRHFPRALHGRGMGHHLDARREASAASGSPRAQNGVCCGNCRLCTEEICLKTGLAKRKATA